MKKLGCLLALLAVPAFAAAPIELNGADKPPCNAGNKGDAYTILDPLTDADCTTGGGSANPHLCICDGTVWRADYPDNHEKVTVTGGGSVGIGTTSPFGQLDVEGGSNINVNLRSTGSTGDINLNLSNAVDSWRLRLEGSTPVGAFEIAQSSTVVFSIEDGSPAASVYVDSSGDVGIGTNAPNSELDVTTSDLFGDLEITADDGAGDNTSWRFRANRSTNELTVIDNAAGVAVVRIADGASLNSLYISPSGQTGLGTTSPNERLTVSGAISLVETSAPSSTTGYGKIWTETTDELYFQDGAGATHVLTPAYAEISAEDNATETTISVVGTYYQVTIFDTNGISRGATPDHTNDHITIGAAGDYQIISSWTINSAAAGGASRADLAIQKNNGASQVGSCHQNRTMAGGGGESGAVVVTCLATLAANDTIEAWIANETNTDNYTVEDITFYVVRLDE